MMISTDFIREGDYRIERYYRNSNYFKSRFLDSTRMEDMLVEVAGFKFIWRRGYRSCRGREGMSREGNVREKDAK